MRFEPWHRPKRRNTAAYSAVQTKTISEETAPVLAHSSAVILYDGDCGLCDRLVQFVLPRDDTGRFRFSALQSDWARARLGELGLSTNELSTMVLLENGKAYLRSTAALRVLRGLPGWWWAYSFIVVPRPVRDLVYSWIARNRIRWFGRPAACGLPKPGWRERFIV